LVESTFQNTLANQDNPYHFQKFGQSYPQQQRCKLKLGLTNYIEQKV
jgi:hypothetical protein